MTLAFYMLDKDRNIIETDDVSEWGDWYADANRWIASANVGDYYVSTVFLSINHSLSGDSDPTLFETMVFNRDWSDVYMDRYRTLEEAEAGHAKVCKLLEAGELELYSNE